LHQAPPQSAVLPLKPLLQCLFGRFAFSQNQTLFPPPITCPRAHMPNDLSPSTPAEAGSTAPTSSFFVAKPVQPIRWQALVASFLLQKANGIFRFASFGRRSASHAWSGEYSRSIPAPSWAPASSRTARRIAPPFAVLALGLGADAVQQSELARELRPLDPLR
jgi:hypothetical protein